MDIHNHNRQNLRLDHTFYPPYQQPLGAPYYWKNEQSGNLGLSILKVWTNDNPSETDIFNTKIYFAHWINAPVWDENPHMTQEMTYQLAVLRQSIKEMNSVESLQSWHKQALLIGIDPL